MSWHGVLPDEEDRIDLPLYISPATPPYISPATLLPKVRAYEMAAPDSICVHHLVARPAGGPVYGFQELGLAEAVLHNLARCQFETPSPLQCYSIPMVLAGRDLLVCAQKGSGKTTALLIPVLSGLVTAPVAAGRTGRMKCVKPRALLLVPTARLVKQIGADIRKFSYRTRIRVHSKMKGKMQKCQLEAGIDIVVSTPRRLINMVRTTQVSLEAIKYLVICELGLMLDMGFEKTLRKIVDDMHIPPKSARHTLLSSGTFQPAVQKLAWDFLSDYLFITDGRLEFSIGLTKQKIELASEEEKRGLLLNLLQKQSVSSAGMSQLRTVVFVETKGKADSLKNWLCNEGFPATVIFADSSQQERESASLPFQISGISILIAANAASPGLDVANVDHLINYDLPKSVEEYVERIRTFARVGSATSFFTESNRSIAKGLLELMIEANLEVPDWLLDYANPDYTRSVELDSEDEENDKDRYDLARSLASRKIDNIYDLACVWAELNCRRTKQSFDDSRIKTMSKDCCIAFTQQEEYKFLKFYFVKVTQHCYSPESYEKTYWHYNFIAKIKSKSGIWTEGIYFAERKLECDVETFCCSFLEPSDDGECYGCQHGEAKVRHPTRGDYERGTPDHVWLSDGDCEISDDDMVDF
ncbi:unnamed protein product [Triticum turgidum subsp. durum]|uniref:RNA helicase n=1 Tax=Triticum turgidum subsp. durum TaxID=4567 RepID=A0A9R1RZX8_TRITD|nr:unnamed protein product [Triticum turgidum subsp. durum]